MLAIQSSGVTFLGDQMPTLLHGRMPTFLQGPPTLLGDASVDALQQFLVMLTANPSASIYTSKSSTGNGSGETDGHAFIVIPDSFFAAVNRALVAAGNAALKVQPLTDQEQFIPDAAARIASASFLTPVVSSAIQTLHGGGMSTKAKVLLGLGAAAVIGGVALIAFGKPHTSRNLHGARRRGR